MNKLELTNYNLQHTLLGGQAFNWDYMNDSYYGFTKDNVIKIKPKDGFILWQTYPEKDNYEFIIHYLNLHDNYEQRLSEISNKDKYIKLAIEKFRGLRILNQDFHQTLLSFILSSNKSVVGIRKAVRNLTKKYGKRIKVDDNIFFLFPKIEDLENISELEFRDIGFGFRAPYFKYAVKKLINNEILSNKKLGEEETRNYLKSYPGIGDKIADCIMVFSLMFNEVTPLDVWGKRVLSDFYGVDSNLKYSKLREWYKDYFGVNTAIAGQYLFEYKRNMKSVT